MIVKNSMIDQALIFAILQEISVLMRDNPLPIGNDHLKHLEQEVDILEYLVAMKREGLIRGDLITNVVSGAPHRMTNIRLTYSGIKILRQ